MRARLVIRASGSRRHAADRPCENEAPMNPAIPERRPATEEISGLIERVTFHNDDSGFCVLRVKADGQREETTVVGSLPSVTHVWTSEESATLTEMHHPQAVQVAPPSQCASRPIRGVLP